MTCSAGKGPHKVNREVKQTNGRGGGTLAMITQTTQTMLSFQHAAKNNDSTVNKTTSKRRTCNEAVLMNTDPAVEGAL